MVAGETPAIKRLREDQGREAEESLRTCVLIASCDAYSDAWDPFFGLFRKYWPDCPFPVYLLTNFLQPEISGVQILSLGADQRWASNMLAALERLPHSRILYLQEDYFLQSRVDTHRVQDALTFFEQTNAGFVRLSGSPNPDRPHANPLGLGLLSPDLKFRVSLQAAIWHRPTLLDLLVPGESGWEMEMQGTARSRSIARPFFGVHSRRPIIDYFRHTGILKGKWVPGALRLCRREGIPVDTSRREIHGDWHFFVKDVRDTAVVSGCRRWLRRLRGRAA